LPSPRRSLRGLRVLLVEDHGDSRRATAEILSAEGAVVTEASNGQAALRSLGDTQPEVLLLDLRLPDVDGFEILKAVHANPPPSLIAVIVLTGDGAVRSREEVEILGAAIVLQKPVEPDELLASLRRLLERSRTRSDNLPSRRRLARGSHETRLEEEPEE
jgi:DNA-binding response OmpR family regulator